MSKIPGKYPLLLPSTRIDIAGIKNWPVRTDKNQIHFTGIPNVMTCFQWEKDRITGFDLKFFVLYRNDACTL
jgi:hypothetical protein